MVEQEDDDVLPMAALGYDEAMLCRLLPRWLPPVTGPTAEQLLALARAPEQGALEQSAPAYGEEASC